MTVLKPLAYSWPIAILFWAALLWVVAGELPLAIRDNRSGRAPADRGSRQAVEALTAAGLFVAFFAAARVRDASIAFARLPLYLAGVALVVAGGLLRRHCFRMLGDSFTFAVRVAAGQTVVDRGAYRYVRHPSYTAGLLLFIGIGLALGNWISLAAGVLPVFGYVYRIRIEEQALVDGLGAAYATYMKRTRRLIPFLC